MSVHMSGKATTDLTDGVTITHNLGYKPIYLIYGKSTTTDAIYPVGGRVTATNENITVKGVQAVLPVEIYYLILKDPMFEE